MASQKDIVRPWARMPEIPEHRALQLPRFPPQAHPHRPRARFDLEELVLGPEPARVPMSRQHRRPHHQMERSVSPRRAAPSGAKKLFWKVVAKGWGYRGRNTDYTIDPESPPDVCGWVKRWVFKFLALGMSNRGKDGTDFEALARSSYLPHHRRHEQRVHTTRQRAHHGQQAGSSHGVRFDEDRYNQPYADFRREQEAQYHDDGEYMDEEYDEEEEIRFNYA